MTNKIGLPGAEYTVPVEPDAGSYKIADAPVAQSQRAIDGTLHTFFAAAKKRWTVSWSGLSAAERDDLLDELRRLAHLSWQPPEGSTYTVRVQRSDWGVTPNASEAYTVTAELEEV